LTDERCEAAWAAVDFDQRARFVAADDDRAGEWHQHRLHAALLLGQHLGHIEQFTDGIHAQHAHSAKSGLQHFVAAGQ
jgi:hypothetical protein